MNVDSKQIELLRRAVVDLNVKWQMYEELFELPENYAVFHRSGPLFWDHFRAYLLDAIFATVSRFFDPAKTYHQENLSLSAATEFEEFTQIKTELDDKLAKLRPVWERGIKIWRHKKISHADMATALGHQSLPDVPISEIRELIVGISVFVKTIDHQLNSVDVSYSIGLSQWVPQVLKYLRAGIEKVDADKKALYGNRWLGGS